MMKEMKYNLNLLICLVIFFVISLMSVYSAKTISSVSLGNIF